MKTRTVRQIEREMQPLREALSALSTEMKEALARQTLRCQHCGKRATVSTLDLIQTYWYEHPYGCTGGDRWHTGDLEWHCKCGRRNRGCYDSNVERLKSFFRDTIKDYG